MSQTSSTGPVEAFDLCGALPQRASTTLLEASAGTGKTYTIAALVARLIAEGEATLDDMLIVTFGRAASQELRERVRGQLVEAERALTADEPSGADALIATLRDCSEAELLARGHRLRDALGAFDGATIATTHQFCQLVLRSLGVAGDTDPGSQLVESLDELLVEVVDDLYVRGFARAPGDPEFDYPQALAIARAAIGDPQARLEPQGSTEAVPQRRLRFAEAVRAEIDKRKRRLGILGYDDLLSRLADALAAPEAPARTRMRERWSIVLVDEFQDTDPVQWQVLDRAFSGHAMMVLIGDPKQAIYAFRGGDVTTYLDAAQTATVHATLGTNHRSDQPVVANIQAVLGGAQLGDERIVVRPVVAAHGGSRLAGAPHPQPFRLRRVSRETFGKSGTTSVTIGPLREHIADDLAADVRELLGSAATFEGHQITPGEVAVLCATRAQCELIRRGLGQAGIPAIITGSGSVYATEAADDWLALLEALDAPRRANVVRSAALTCFFGHRASELGGPEAESEALTDVVGDTLRGWAELARLRGIAAVFETATALGLPARVLALPDGERVMTDLRHLAESLHDAAMREQLDLSALLAWMRRRMAEHRLDVTGERTRRLDSDARAIQILTIHASKGLQFPVVYLPFVADRFPQDPEFPRFHDVTGQRCLDVGGQGDGRSQAKAELAGEDLRLLYVALTRAQSQVVAWWLPNSKNTVTSPLHRMLFGRGPGEPAVKAQVPLKSDEAVWADLLKWQEAGGPHLEESVIAPAPEVSLGESPGPLAARRWTRHVDQDWRRTSYSALSAAASAYQEVVENNALVAAFGSEPEDPPRSDEPEAPELAVEELADPHPSPEGAAAQALDSPMAALPVGATFGSLVHAVLEHADPQAPDQGGDLRAELLHHIAEQRVRWPVDLDAEVVADALVAACDTPLGALVGDATLRDITTKDRLCELDFELPLGGGDLRTEPALRQRLSGLAPLLREHLPVGDPLRGYAEVLETEGHQAQVLAGYLSGSVDVVLRTGGRFVIVDYKSNWLGPREEPLTAYNYRPAALAEAMTHSSYPLQALLYAVVLHRFLRWRVRDYAYETHFGGVMYLYLRGLCGPQTPLIDGERCGVFSWSPPIALVEAVSGLLDGKVAP